MYIDNLKATQKLPNTRPKQAKSNNKQIATEVAYSKLYSTLTPTTTSDSKAEAEAATGAYINNETCCTTTSCTKMSHYAGHKKVAANTF